jgi:uncharacterized membrane protein
MLPATLLLLSFVLRRTLQLQIHCSAKLCLRYETIDRSSINISLCLAATYIIGHPDVNVSGRAAMSLMLAFTAIGHFKFTNGMAMMLPSSIPAKKQIVLATGVIEILAAIGLLVLSTIKITGILLIAFFVLILPANIYAALKNINLEKADNSGNGINYLWFRIPEQVFFIAWVYFFAIR